MEQEITLTLTPREAATEDSYAQYAAKALHIEESRILDVKIIKRSLDARKKDVKVILRLLLSIDEPTKLIEPNFNFQNVSNKQEVVIVGAGPAGLFAALRLIELGFKPIILERGKDIHKRRLDIARLNRNEAFNSESNYCFGEGGAGTFSDGKLYTRSNKRGNIHRILEALYFHGASEEVLYEAHPHIGTDKLPTIIENIRRTITTFGGNIHFETHVIDILTNGSQVAGVKTQDGNLFNCKHIILATGHSARDTYEMFAKKGIALEAKSFAMGVRVEHPQHLIDCIQYHSQEGRGEFLPAASYSLVTQIEDRGVYSFCMCPGGIIVPATTAEHEIVVNGMSASSRNSEFANSGIAVEIRASDLSGNKSDPLIGLHFQKDLERKAYNNAGPAMQAPAQRLLDFVQGKPSTSLPKSSYLPGLVCSPLHNWLPDFICRRLQKGFEAFDRKMHGFLTNEAIIVGVESRTSSPVRIPRDPETLEHIEIHGLYPCGEGAGYAGGIVSSAMDGQKCAEKIAGL